MNDLFSAAGPFVWPLLACSMLAVFITVERLLALRSNAVMPSKIVEQLIAGEVPKAASGNSLAARLLRFFHLQKPDADSLKAFAVLEVSRLQRGMFLLDTIIGAAPLLGLLGTVTGLVSVFSAIDPQTGIPDAMMFVEGIALALATTVIGLAIAIPALIANGYLNRRIDVLAAQINVAVERLIDLSNRQQPAA